MTRFTHENFYIIESLIGIISIGCILAVCIRDSLRSRDRSKRLSAAIEDSHRQLQAENLNREEVSKAMAIIRRRLRKK